MYACGAAAGLREYLAGLLAPRDRNKTLTAPAGAEPVAGAQQSPAAERRATRGRPAAVVLAAGAARGPQLAFPWTVLPRWWTAWFKPPP